MFRMNRILDRAGIGQELFFFLGLSMRFFNLVLFRSNHLVKAPSSTADLNTLYPALSVLRFDVNAGGN